MLIMRDDILNDNCKCDTQAYAIQLCDCTVYTTFTGQINLYVDKRESISQ